MCIISNQVVGQVLQTSISPDLARHKRHEDIPPFSAYSWEASCGGGGGTLTNGIAMLPKG